MKTKAKLGAKAIGRRELENNEGYELKEPQTKVLTTVFLTLKSEALDRKTTLFGKLLKKHKHIAWSDKRYLV